MYNSIYSRFHKFAAPFIIVGAFPITYGCIRGKQPFKWVQLPFIWCLSSSMISLLSHLSYPRSAWMYFWVIAFCYTYFSLIFSASRIAEVLVLIDKFERRLNCFTGDVAVKDPKWWYVIVGIVLLSSIVSNFYSSVLTYVLLFHHTTYISCSVGMFSYLAETLAEYARVLSSLAKPKKTESYQEQLRILYCDLNRATRALSTALGPSMLGMILSGFVWCVVTIVCFDHSKINSPVQLITTLISLFVIADSSDRLLKQSKNLLRNYEISPGEEDSTIQSLYIRNILKKHPLSANCYRMFSVDRKQMGYFSTLLITYAIVVWQFPPVVEYLSLYFSSSLGDLTKMYESE